jgi:hypothetical protein
MQYGRKNNRSLLTPSNQGMARRVDKRLDSIVNSQAAKFENSLAVDGVPCVVWNRNTHNSNRKCTCSNTAGAYFGESQGNTIIDSDSSDNYTSSTLLDDNEVEYSVTSGAFIIETDLNRSNDLYEYVGESLTMGNYDGYFAGKQAVESIQDKLQPTDSYLTNLRLLTGEEPIGGDLIDAISDSGEIPDFDADDDPLRDVKNVEINDFDNPVNTSTEDLFNSVSLSCPICIGTGYVDEWQPFNGSRIVLDITHPGCELLDSDIAATKPVSVELPAQGSIMFKSITIPMEWNHVVSLHVFNMGKFLINGYDYVFYYSTISAPDTWLPFSYSVLSTFKNKIRQNKINIKITAKRLITFTHCVLMFHVGKVIKIQVPELDVPNQSEFIDWNLTVQFEVSPKTQIKENSYITEAKYGRIWKVESVNRRLNAGGKSFGYQVSARAIHSYEKAAMMLRVFGDYVDPFSLDVDKNMDLEL